MFLETDLTYNNFADLSYYLQSRGRRPRGSIILPRHRFKNSLFTYSSSKWTPRDVYLNLYARQKVLLNLTPEQIAKGEDALRIPFQKWNEISYDPDVKKQFDALLVPTREKIREMKKWKEFREFSESSDSE